MERKKKKDNLLIKNSDAFTCWELSDERFGKLIKAVIMYGYDGTTPTDFDPELATMFKFFKTTTDNNNTEYQRISEERSKAGKRGNEANQANQANPANQANAAFASNPANQANPADMICSDVMCSDVMCSDVKCSDNIFSDEKKFLEKPSPGGDVKKSAQKKFVKPSLEEVTEYCKKMNYIFSPEAFFAHYESNGWKVNRNPMKNWHMACVTWQTEEKRRVAERQERYGRASPPSPPPKEQIKSPIPEYTDEEWNRLTLWEQDEAVHRHYGLD